MVNRGKSRIMCINCNLCINKLRRYPALELDTKITSLLSEWVHPQIITQDDVVCEACKDLAMAKVNVFIKQEVTDDDCQQAGPSPRGHTNVCPLCGISILRRQSNKILSDNPSELHQAIYDIIQNRLAPQQITESDRVCHACWLRTRRQVLRINSLAKSLLSIKDAPQEPEPQEPATLTEPSTSGSTPAENSRLVDVKKIALPNYRRAPNTTKSCVFPKCSSGTSLHLISDKLRAIVLSHHKYYLPKQARLCDHHLKSNSWETLFDSENSMQTFTIEQIEHVFSFVNTPNQTLDFENLQDIDDRVFEYCMGITKEKFNSLLERVPQIKEIRRGSLGLAALLVKKRTGDANAKISTLLQVPCRTLEGLMAKVRDVIGQNFVLENII